MPADVGAFSCQATQHAFTVKRASSRPLHVRCQLGLSGRSTDVHPSHLSAVLVEFLRALVSSSQTAPRPLSHG